MKTPYTVERVIDFCTVERIKGNVIDLHTAERVEWQVVDTRTNKTLHTADRKRDAVSWINTHANA